MRQPTPDLSAAVGVRFTKMSGAGNDFVVLVEPPEGPDLADLSRRLCRRGISIGADGLFVLHRRPGGARMTHYNADGGLAELCLNGTRCAAAMALRLGWDGKDRPGHVVIETGAGPVRAAACGEGIQMHVPAPSPVHDIELDLERQLPGVDVTAVGLPTPPDDPTGVVAAACNSGVPHLVVLVDPDVLPTLDLERLGPPLRAHPDLGPAGANVNFLASTGNLRVLRTFERGVEGETLACGTGAVASAAVLLRGAAGEHVFQTRGGFDQVVEARAEPTGEYAWTLTGEARFVAEGTIEEGALFLAADGG